MSAIHKEPWNDTIAEIHRLFGDLSYYNRTWRKWMPLSPPKSNFDIDLDFGQKWEEKLRYIFEEDGRIEVKTEKGQWLKTGNIAIEYKYKGKPSGISTTSAKWWIHVLQHDGTMKSSVMFEVSELKSLIKKLLSIGVAKTIKGGDDKESSLVLIPLDYLHQV